MARMVGPKIAEPSSFPASRLFGMNTQHCMPRRAACADTEFARLPVDAQASTVEAELPGARRRHRDDAVLVGQRRMVDRIVLDVELAQASRSARRVQRTSGV